MTHAKTNERRPARRSALGRAGRDVHPSCVARLAASPSGGRSGGFAPFAIARWYAERGAGGCGRAPRVAMGRGCRHVSRTWPGLLTARGRPPRGRAARASRIAPRRRRASRSAHRTPVRRRSRRLRSPNVVLRLLSRSRRTSRPRTIGRSRSSCARTSPACPRRCRRARACRRRPRARTCGWGRASRDAW